MIRFALVCLLSLSALAAPAAPLQPNSGLWWEEPVTGRFYAVEIAPSGRSYVVVSEFDAAGKPVWRAMRGELVLASEAEQAAGAPLATLRATLQDLDGACPSCPPVSPGVRPSPLGEASIVFLTHARAEYRQGDIRRPLRYFSPADQPQDFPSARLAGDYVLAMAGVTEPESRAARLQPAGDVACSRHEGAQPPAGAIRLRASCASGFCDSSSGGVLLSALEFAVGPGEHPAIVAYRRQYPADAVRSLIFVPGFPVGYYTCPTGFTRQPISPLGPDFCVRDNAPLVCVESHRITEHAGTIRGLPLESREKSFALHPVR